MTTETPMAAAEAPEPKSYRVRFMVTVRAEAEAVQSHDFEAADDAAAEAVVRGMHDHGLMAGSEGIEGDEIAYLSCIDEDEAE